MKNIAAISEDNLRHSPITFFVHFFCFQFRALVSRIKAIPSKPLLRVFPSKTMALKNIPLPMEKSSFIIGETFLNPKQNYREEICYVPC